MIAAKIEGPEKSAANVQLIWTVFAFPRTVM